MKKIFGILLCASVLLPLSSCFKQEDDIWEQSSAQRTEAKVNEYYELLTSAENGWVMEYFANESEKGYPIIVKFDAHKNVLMAANNAVSSGGAYKEQNGNYEIISDQGPVLTFNVNNSLLHTFADPSSDGIGHNGDYEFVIYEGDSEHFKMKGKKHGLEVYLYKMPADQDWETYYDKITEHMDAMFSTQVPELTMTAGGLNYTISVSDGVMVFLPEGGDPATDAVSDPFVVRLDGTVHFCTPFEGRNFDLALQNFKLSEDGSKLECIDEGQTGVISGPSLIDQLLNASLTWDIDASLDGTGAYANMSGELAAAYDAVVKGAEALGMTVDCGVVFDALTSSFALQVNIHSSSSSNPMIALFYMELNPSDGGISIVADGSGDDNSIPYSNAIPALKDFVQAVNGTYTVDVFNCVPFMPETLKLVSKDNAEDYFVLTKPAGE